MRRFAAVLLSLVLLVTMAATGFAASDVRVLLDEQEVQFDASPFIEGGRTLVPVRALAERLGFTVGWDEAAQKITLTKGETTILLWINSNKVVVNGKEGTVDVAPKKVNNRTFVPVRFVAERLGTHVTWDEKRNAAVVSSGQALYAKMDKQKKPVDQKTTGDVQLELTVSDPGHATGSTVSLKMPVHMDMHVYHNDVLANVTMQLPALGQPTTGPMTMHLAVKDGQLYTQDPITQKWQKQGSAGTGIADLSTFEKTGLTELMKLQAELVQQAVVSVGAEEQIDGVQVLRLDVDLSKVNISAVIDKMLATLPVAGGAKPDIKISIDRFLVHYWINPETQFVHKEALDAVVNLTVSDATQKMSFKLTMAGEFNNKPVSEPIKFPDFAAPVFTAEQKQAAQAYWDGVQKNFVNCAVATKKADAHWADKTYADGTTDAVVAAGCYVQQRMALAGLKPPTDFADTHKALGISLETSEKAYAAFGQAFDLAAKGDMTASDAKKADAAKLAKAGQQSLTQALLQFMQLVAKYELK